MVKHILLAHIALRKKMEKWAIFDKNHEKPQFFDCFFFFFYSLESRFFVLEYRKTHISGLYCLKKKHGKMAIFGPKQWVNPFEKTSISRLFHLAVFIA